jgi:hypothetical protein
MPDLFAVCFEGIRELEGQLAAQSSCGSPAAVRKLGCDMLAICVAGFWSGATIPRAGGRGSLFWLVQTKVDSCRAEPGSGVSG